VTCPGEYEIIAGSPIIIDAAGAGFQLTSIDNGVKFDLMGDGRRRQVAWTARGTRNAFLALDWDGDGKIDSGKELFGNFTPQPERAEKNGFAALAEYDKPAKGGNGDGIIDEHDAVWPHLRLWINANHDAIAQTSELFTLPQLGVYSLGIKWSKFPTNDAFGNVFMYSAAVNPNLKDGTSKDGRIAYDVFLRMQP